MTVLLAFGQGMVVALAAWAAVNDIRFRRIPNWTSAGIALLALTLAAAGAGDMATALAIGAGAFVASLVIHLIGMVGAGDVKLFAALSIWVGAERYLAFMISLAIATLLLSAYSLATRRGALRAANRPDLATLPRRTTLPLGLALSAAALCASLA